MDDDYKSHHWTKPPTVAELIKALGEYDPELPVFGYDGRAQLLSIALFEGNGENEDGDECPALIIDVS